MTTINEYIEHYRQRLHTLLDDPDVLVKAKALRSEFQAYLATLNESDRAQAKALFGTPRTAQEQGERVDEAIRGLETAYLKAKGAVTYEGRVYPFGEWVTIADYCRLYNQKPNTVMNWIAREVVPPSHVVTIPELNQLKLLKNERYAPRAA